MAVKKKKGGRPRSKPKQHSQEKPNEQTVRDDPPPAPAAAADSTPEHGKILIVGVGASAGGLEAFSQLLRALPARPGLALIFVQHIAPQHESALAKLLAGATDLPVVQPTEDTTIEVDHVYVIPPNRTLTLNAGRLIVLPRPSDRSQYTPIDTLLESLADVQGADAVGVILSGTASDGVEGVHAIKAVGGTVLVQDPETAKQDSMPRSAIATGKTDFVLAPDEIAQELLRLAVHRPARGIVPRRPQDSLVLHQEHLGRIFGQLRSVTGVDFHQYKLPTVQRRIQRRMALHKMDSVEQYVKFLVDDPAEVQQLYKDLLIHVTRFFRDPESFSALENDIFPAMLQARQADAPIRIWVPACSTGEEPYSIAIALMDCLHCKTEGVPIQIFATDISETAIEQARSGLYPPSSVAELSPQRLAQFFTPTDGQYRINKPIRDLCVFARQDLTRDPPFSKLDLIVCRNVLIYLGQQIQARLMSVFHYALKSNSYLMLGSAETIGLHSDLFSVADKKHRIYRKKTAETPMDVQFNLPYSRPPATRSPRGEGGARGGSSLLAEANRLILDRYSPAGVIVNEEMRIIQFRGQTGKFLEPAPGDASLNLLKMCREGLLHGLRTALQGAKKKDAAVRREGLRVKTNGDYVNVTVEVIPLPAESEGRHYLILFREAAPPPGGATVAVHKPRGRASARDQVEETERLQKELVASREYLQSIIQDLEAANEELQSANEEILSSNEELQSTNEELDTAKEELQSTNEELNTVNEELHGRNEELGRINSDLVNVLNGVQIAIVIVSGDLRIRRFTPMAERILNMIPGDIGRPIGQLKPNINVPDLERLILDVMDSMTIEIREVQDSQGRTFSLTVRPYKSIDNRIDGAVLSLFDIDEVRRHQRRAEEAREYAEEVFNTVRDPLAVLDGELRVKSVNPAFCRQFKVFKNEVEGKLLHELDGQQWNDSRLQQVLAGVLQSNSQLDNFSIVRETEGEAPQRLALSARKIAASDHRPALILLALQKEDSAPA